MTEQPTPRRWYVTLTWDDWPEGGSYGTVIPAEMMACTGEEAVAMAKREMAETRAFECNPDAPPDRHEALVDQILRDYGDEWHVVDCFIVDDFIARHSKPLVGAEPDLDEDAEPDVEVTRDARRALLGQTRVTVVCTEERTPMPPAYHRPLIYDLDTAVPVDHDALRLELATIRYDEIEGIFDPNDPEAVAKRDEIAEGLLIDFVIAGPVKVLADFRE